MSEDIRQRIIGWNTQFPMDRWWRIKHNIPFLSQAHREASFIDQLYEFEEDKFFEEIVGDKSSEDKYIPGSGDIFKRGCKVNVQDFAKEAKAEIDKMLKEEDDGR